MSRRTNTERCATCQMHVTLCICGLTPCLQTRTRLALVIHYREARKPTNTGQLAARCLARSSVEIVGDRDRPLRVLTACDDERAVVLFPSDDAVPITDYATSDQPLVLIVPDGNWRQASKMRRRIPGLDRVPCVSFAGAAPTEYRLRAERRVDGLATFEAIARALRILEGAAGPAIETAMMAVLRVMIDRTLWFRGALRDDDVTDGVPHAAVAHDPRGTRR